MHYLLQQVNNLYLSSWRNKAYLAVLALLSSFIIISVAWHAYDSINVVQLVYQQNDVEKVTGAKMTAARKTRFQPLAIFGSHEKVPERVNRSLKLLGVIESTHFSNSRAIIASQKRRGEIYTVGDEISSGLKLHRVFNNRVILNRSGVLETLYLDWGEISHQTTKAGVEPLSKPLIPRGYGGGYFNRLGNGIGDVEGISERLREYRESGKYKNGNKDIDIDAVKERIKGMRSLRMGTQE